MSYSIPASFWIHPDNVPLSTKIVYRTGTTAVISIPITAYTRMFAQDVPRPLIEEVLNDTSKPVKLYFEIKSSQDEDIEPALAFLRRNTPSREIVLSSYLYEGMMRTRIICKDVATTDRQVIADIATLGVSKGLAFDTNIYGPDTKLQAICSVGVGLHCVRVDPPPTTCFVDYVIQAVPTSAQMMPLSSVTLTYQCSGTSFIEEVIYAIDFNKIPLITKIRLIGIMKIHKLRQLYSYKLSIAEGEFEVNDTYRVEDEDTVAYMALVSSEPAKAQALLAKYRMIVVNDQVKRDVASETVTSAAVPSVQLGEQERIILRDLLTEKIAALTRICYSLC